MTATTKGAGRRLQVERMIDLGANVVEAPGLVAVAGALGVAMHRVRYPQHAAAFATPGFQQRWQRLGDVRRAHPVNQGQSALLVARIERVDLRYNPFRCHPRPHKLARKPMWT